MFLLPQGFHSESVFMFCFLSPQTYGDSWGKIQRALAIWSGFGMTLTGVQTCGDYMFSGHTVVITMLNFFVTECEYSFTCLPSLDASM